MFYRIRANTGREEDSLPRLDNYECHIKYSSDFSPFRGEMVPFIAVPVVGLLEKRGCQLGSELVEFAVRIISKFPSPETLKFSSLIL